MVAPKPPASDFPMFGGWHNSRVITGAYLPGCGRCWQPRCTSLIHLLSHSPKRLVHIMYLFKSSASHSPILSFRSNLASYSTEKTGLIQDTVQTRLPPPLPSCTWAFLIRSVSPSVHRPTPSHPFKGIDAAVVLPHIVSFLSLLEGFLRGSNSKKSACNVRDQGSIPGSGRFPWRKARWPTPVFLPRESHGLRRLAGDSPRCCSQTQLRF